MSDIKALRSQLARGMLSSAATARLPFAATGLLAVRGRWDRAWLQWIRKSPANDLSAYLSLWVATAALSVTIIGTEVVTRTRRVFIPAWPTR